MFYLDKESASAGLLDSASTTLLYVWRYIPPSKYSLDESGLASAKGVAFDIRRRKDGTIKEPSASLFELRDFKDGCRDTSLRFLHGMSESKGFEIKASTASGALDLSEVREIKKDPQAFTLVVSPGQGNDVMLHWDLTYAKDDLEEEMISVKNALAIACRVYVKGDCDLMPCSLSAKSPPTSSDAG